MSLLLIRVLTVQTIGNTISKFTEKLRSRKAYRQLDGVRRAHKNLSAIEGHLEILTELSVAVMREHNINGVARKD